MTKTKKKILSIDGGGIRGIIPAIILAEIERRTQKRISDMFDLVAGTSTGGLIATMLVSQRHPSAQNVVDLYEKRGHEIFSRDLCEIIFSFASLSDHKFSSNGISKVLSDVLGDETIDGVKKDLLITAYDINNREPYFFKSWRPDFNGIPLVTICKATSAAPTYFEPVDTSIQGKDRTFIDGGVFVNNPAVSAYVEAMRIYGPDVYVLSLGTGVLVESIKYEDAKSWGKIEWISPLLDCMFGASSDVVDYQMNMLLGEDFTRLQLKNIKDENMALDDASDDNIAALKLATKEFIEKNTVQIDNIIKRIAC